MKQIAGPIGKFPYSNGAECNPTIAKHWVALWISSIRKEKLIMWSRNVLYLLRHYLFIGLKKIKQMFTYILVALTRFLPMHHS